MTSARVENGARRAPLCQTIALREGTERPRPNQAASALVRASSGITARRGARQTLLGSAVRAGILDQPCLPWVRTQLARKITMSTYCAL